MVRRKKRQKPQKELKVLAPWDKAEEIENQTQMRGAIPNHGPYVIKRKVGKNGRPKTLERYSNGLIYINTPKGPIVGISPQNSLDVLSRYNEENECQIGVY